MAKGGAKFVMVTVDYFMKWVEAKVLASITSQTIKKFLWRLVVCRFGIPHTFVLNNGKQLVYSHFLDWCIARDQGKILISRTPTGQQSG